jgi:hypothetical protein
MVGDIEYGIRGFLTVRRDSLRVPLRGSLTVRVVPGSGHFTRNLVLRPAAVGRRVLGVSLFGATVRIEAESPVTGRIDEQGQMSATVTVDAVLTADSGHQPAGSRPGECRGHRPHPEYITARMPGPEVSGGRDDRPEPTGSAWLTFLSGARRMVCRGGWRRHGGTRTSWTG